MKICDLCKANFEGKGNKAMISQSLTVCNECSIAEDRIEREACDRVIKLNNELISMLVSRDVVDKALSKFCRR